MATTNARPTCGVCQTSVEQDEPAAACPECRGVFHVSCWEANGGCATYSCPASPHVSRSDDPTREEDSYWGLTTKVCPMCQERIGIAELRCPACRTEFGTARPLTREELYAPRAVAGPARTLTKPALLIFLVSLLGVTGPLNLILGGVWYALHRRQLRRESPLHYLLSTVGLAVSAFYTLLMTIGIARS